MRQLHRILVLTALAAASAGVLVGTVSAFQEPTIQDRIMEAKSKADVGTFGEAIRIFEDVIRRVNISPDPEATKRALLIEAYLNRGIAYVGQNDLESAKRDFRQMFGLNPTQMLPTTTPAIVPIQRLRQTFDEAQRTVVGTLRLTVKPADADVLLNDAKVADPGAPILLSAGTYRVSASRKSFGSLQQQVQIVAGEVMPLDITLERASSTVFIVTVPPDVEVMLGDVSKGKTQPGPAPSEYSGNLSTLGVRPVDASARMEITEVPAGSYELKFRKPCYVDQSFTLDARQLRDYTFSEKPFRLDRAVGTIRLTGDAGTVFQDDVDKGPTRVLSDVCEGQTKIEVRSPVGRFVQIVDVRRGTDQTLNATVKPALALLALTGEKVIGTDARELLAKRFDATNPLTVFQPSPAQVAAALKAAQVSEGWLSSPPAGFTPPARREASKRLAEALGVQAVGEVNVASAANFSDVTLTFVAAGSSKSDTMFFPLAGADTRAIGERMIRMNTIPPLFENSVGLEVADIYDVSNTMAVVVVSVDPASTAAKAGIAPGDIVSKANELSMTSTGSFQRVLAAAKDGDMLPVEVKDRDTSKPNKRASLRVVAGPAAIGQDDETLIPNRLIMEYRRQLAGASGLLESVLHLNLGVALMKVESWEEAIAELKLVILTQRRGVSVGTVQYLLARCYRERGLIAEEAAALDTAAKDEFAQLVVNGPYITGLVKRDRDARAGIR